RGIETEAPGVSQAIGPNFRPSALQADERIILGDAVCASPRWVVDIDTEHGGQQIAQILAGFMWIRAGCAVAGGDVQHAVGSKGQAAAIMTVRLPGDDLLL